MSRAAACSGVVLPGVPLSSASQLSWPERVTLYRAVASSPRVLGARDGQPPLLAVGGQFQDRVPAGVDEDLPALRGAVRRG